MCMASACVSVGADAVLWVVQLVWLAWLAQLYWLRVDPVVDVICNGPFAFPSRGLCPFDGLVGMFGGAVNDWLWSRAKLQAAVRVIVQVCVCAVFRPLEVTS